MTKKEATFSRMIVISGYLIYYILSLTETTVAQLDVFFSSDYL